MYCFELNDTDFLKNKWPVTASATDDYVDTKLQGVRSFQIKELSDQKQIKFLLIGGDIVTKAWVKTGDISIKENFAQVISTTGSTLKTGVTGSLTGWNLE